MSLDEPSGCRTKARNNQSGAGGKFPLVGPLDLAKKLAFDPGSNTCFCRHATQLAGRRQETRVIYLCNRESYFRSSLCIFVGLKFIGKVCPSVLMNDANPKDKNCSLHFQHGAPSLCTGPAQRTRAGVLSHSAMWGGQGADAHH